MKAENTLPSLCLLLLYYVGSVRADDGVEEKDENVTAAVLLSLAAGLATAIGGATPFFPAFRKMAQPKVLSASLALSSGVMLYVSFVEIFVKSNDSITLGLGNGQTHVTTREGDRIIESEEVGFVYPGNKYANLYTTLAFFGGCIVVMLLHWLVHFLSPETDQLEDPDVIEHHESGDAEVPSNNEPVGESGRNDELSAAKKKSLSKMGLLTALALGLHNFPEGFATFIATLEDPSLGAALAIAIAIHNIPEGICVAMPVYYATGSKWKAFGWALLSGLSEPVGGVLGWLALRSVFTDLVFGIVFGIVGGMMVWIVLQELLPTSYSHDPTGKLVGPFVFLGMVVISASLLAFAFA